MVSSYSGYYTGLSSRISGFDSPRDRQTVGVWCNGNTVDFDSTALGSIPGTPAILKHILMPIGNRVDRLLYGV